MPRLRSGSSSSSRGGPAEGEAGGLDLQPVNLPPSHHHSISYRISPLGGTLSQLQRALESLQSGAENLQHELSSTLPFFSWGSSGSGNGGGSLHSLKRDLSNSGLVVGSGPAAQERMRALLGLAVVNLCALGGSASALLSPQGPGGCDHNIYERCANCATSAPFVMVGVHALRRRQTVDGKAWGASMCAVGMCSTAFHASTGKWRTLGRRLDYWSIAMSSNIMLRAVVPNVPPALTVLSMALTPFKPFIVSFCNSAAMEYRFLTRPAFNVWGAAMQALLHLDAHQNKALQRTQRIHAGTIVLGLGCFFLEEYNPRLPFVHALWHILSASSVATVNGLVEDVENEQLQKRLEMRPLGL